MKLKANRGDIPAVCPGCGYETGDPEEMVEHWRQAGELNFNGNMVEVPRGGKMVVTQPKAIDNPLAGLSKFSVEELLQRKDALPWWLGLGLIAMALTIPGTRSMILRLVHIAMQVMVWGIAIIASLAAVLVWAIVYWGPKLASWASAYRDRFWMAP